MKLHNGFSCERTNEQTNERGAGQKFFRVARANSWKCYVGAIYDILYQQLFNIFNYFNYLLF